MMMMIRNPTLRFALSTMSSPLAPKTQSFAASVLRIGRHLSTYKFNSLVEWLEGDGKSVLLSPGFRDPRTRVGHNYNYVPLKYEGVERKKMLETVTREWIGGALHKLNVSNGKLDAYAIVGGSGTGKTRFLGEMVEQWDQLRALSADDARSNPMGTPSREIPLDTLVFPICFNFLTCVTSAERNLILFLLSGKKDDYMVTSTTFPSLFQ
jgi:hypothetical protein